MFVDPTTVQAGADLILAEIISKLAE